MTETQAPPINPSPKQRFLWNKKFLEDHRRIVFSDEIQRSLDYALLQYNSQLCEQNADANGAAANHFKMRGAMEFVHVLKNLSESPKPPTVYRDGNLNHEA